MVGGVALGVGGGMGLERGVEVERAPAKVTVRVAWVVGCVDRLGPVAAAAAMVAAAWAAPTAVEELAAEAAAALAVVRAAEAWAAAMAPAMAVARAAEVPVAEREVMAVEVEAGRCSNSHNSRTGGQANGASSAR